MKKLIVCMLLFITSVNAFANCDWSTIKKLPNGDFDYSPTLHICVGKLVQDAAVKDQQISDLNQAITLKDLALKESDSRTQLWMTTSTNELDRLNKISSDEKSSQWLWFGLGVATTFLAGYGAAKLVGR